MSELFTWWSSLSPAAAGALKALLIVVWLMAGGSLAYYLLRLGLGHRRFDGHWYTAAAWQAYLRNLERRQREGMPLRAKEARLLGRQRTRRRRRATH